VAGLTIRHRKKKKKKKHRALKYHKGYGLGQLTQEISMTDLYE
jgi:hypothetical protein